MTGTTVLVLDLIGPLCLRDGSGREITPKARKAQGLLALLATAPGLRRSRTWIQDKLWSDRGPEQGAASLRQCLTELRRNLGSAAEALRTEAGWIALDPARVQVRATPRPGAVADVGSELLEGLDIRDPEFEHWLRDQRSAWEDRVEGAEAAVRPLAHGSGVIGRPLLFVGPAESEREDLRIFADMFASGIGMRIAEAGDAQVIEALPVGQTRLPGLRISVRAAEIGASFYLQVRLAELATGTIIWIGLREFEPGRPLAQSEGPVAQLGNEAVVVAVEELRALAEAASDEERLALLGYQASRHAILLDHAEQIEADTLLERAYAMRPLGIFLARRALLRCVQIVERMPIDHARAHGEAVEMARRSLDMAPNNTIVLATASWVSLVLEGKVQGGSALARRALEVGPTNSLAWESMATAHAHSGRPDEAHAAALKAREFSAHLPQNFYWDMICCMTATVAGRYEEAIRFGETARELAPTFKPPLRYLAALYYRAGRTEAAARQLEILKQLEPDFSLSMLESDDYPVAGLRRTPLIRLAGSGLL